LVRLAQQGIRFGFLIKGIFMRNASQFLAATALCIAVGMLAACGGGGDSAPVAVSPTPTPTPTPAPEPAPAPIVGPSVVVTGTATFALVPSNTATGALDYNAVSNKPARGITVQAVSGSTVLATTSASDQGTYALTLPANTPFFLRMRAELINTAGVANWNVSVKDNTAGNALWVVDGLAASSGAVNSVRSIFAASGWNGSSYGGARAAGPFAILDTVYSGMKLVSSAQANTQFPPLTVYWSPNNTTARDNLALGEIGTSFFTTETQGPNVSRMIYILGKDGNDTDEYDSSVVAHEYGHYLQSAFSTNHSLGGGHSGLNKLDMTLAFSEGWGNAWSSMARNNSVYNDSFGVQQGRGVAYNLAIPPSDSAIGWYREDSVDSSLYALFVSQGFAPIWTALTGPMKTSQVAMASIFSFADAVRSAGNSAVTAVLNSLLGAQKIFTGPGANQWGFGESNDGGMASNLPVYSSLTLGVSAQTCFTNANMTDGSVNKLGAVKYFRINLPQAGSRTVTATFPNGRDVDFEIYQNRDFLGAGYSSVATSETQVVNFSAGEAVIRVYDDKTAAPGNVPTTICSTITVN
jgi:hypothetical protein